MKKYTIDEINEIGKEIAIILCLQSDREYHGRWLTMWGSKTNTGIFNTILKLAENIKKGCKIEA